MVKDGTRAAGLCLMLWTVSLFQASPPGAAGTEDARDFASVVDQARRGTVGILARDASAPSSSGDVSVRGSGLYLGDGYVLTARHATIRRAGGHAPDPPRITVISNAMEEASAALVGVNHFLDIALYRIPDAHIPGGLSAQRFAQDEALPGERVFTVGYPLGWGPAVSYGYVGNPDTFLRTVESRLVQVDLSACSGNSGGGLFNARGDVVGVIHAIIQTGTAREERRCSRFAFAVPGTFADKIVAALMRGAPFHFATLGLRLDAVKIGNRWRVAVANATGPAQRAGLQPGDVLLSIDGQRVDSAGQLKSHVMEQTRPRQAVTLRILRDNREQVMRLVPEQARDAARARSSRRAGTPSED